MPPDQPSSGSAAHVAEGRYAQELAHGATPEEVFERRWAFTVLEQVFDNLRREYTDAGKGTLFAHLQPFLGGDTDTVSYRDIATTLEMTEGAVKVAVHRLRRRCRALLLAEIAHISRIQPMSMPSSSAGGR